jgi:uncharacterized protein YbaR (Trm112 family)
MVEPELLKILRCPETHQLLRVAEPALVDSLNQQITGGTLRNRAGQRLNEKIDDGLIRADGRMLYPVRQDIPVLLVEEAIPLAVCEL